MGTYDYSQPAAPQPSTSPAWFDQMPGGSIPPEPPRSNGRRKFVLIAASAVFLLIGLGAAIASATIFAPPRCLDTNDYKALTGSVADPQLLSPQSFYTAAIEYDFATELYSDDSTADTEKLIRDIGSFYAARAKTASIVITLSSEYDDTDRRSIAENRLRKLREALLAAGVAETAIKQQSPTDPAAANTAGEEFDTPVVSTVYITIASSTDCS